MTSLREEYCHRFEHGLVPVAAALEEHVSCLLAEEPRIDRVSARAKDVERFLTKAGREEEGRRKYSDPLNQIQDQIGVRIVTFYAGDVARLSTTVERYFRPIEARAIVPDSEWEFGYFGKHYILIIPGDVVSPEISGDLVPNFFELQIKTLFQHAWSEANHDLGYKPSGDSELTSEQKRRLAFTSAQAWGADRVFDELFRELAAGAKA